MLWKAILILFKLTTKRSCTVYLLSWPDSREGWEFIFLYQNNLYLSATDILHA